MSISSKSDRIYASAQSVAPFSFDEQVAEVFPDMIQRSVPGYATIIDTIGQIAARFAQPGSRLYDLGCSLGAATLAMRRSVVSPECCIIAVDNSPAMTERARRHIEAFRGDVPVDVRCADICELAIEDASVVVLNFTLQFIPAGQRQAMLDKIAAGMRPGGVLVLSEKLAFEQPGIGELLVDLHLDFKRTNGYSELEISQKRQALENVLVPDTRATHVQRLRDAGFSQVDTWYQCHNFASLVAIR